MTSHSSLIFILLFVLLHIVHSIPVQKEFQKANEMANENQRKMKMKSDYDIQLLLRPEETNSPAVDLCILHASFCCIEPIPTRQYCIDLYCNGLRRKLARDVC